MSIEVEHETGPSFSKRPARTYGNKRKSTSTANDAEVPVTEKEDNNNNNSAQTVAPSNLQAVPSSSTHPAEDAVPWVLSSDDLSKLVLPPLSGWTWYTPSMQSASQLQYLNEISIVNLQAVVSKFLRVDIKVGEAHLLIPGTSFTSVQSFASLSELQEIFNQSHRAPLCKGFPYDEKHHYSKESTSGFLKDGFWHANR